MEFTLHRKHGTELVEAKAVIDQSQCEQLPIGQNVLDERRVAEGAPQVARRHRPERRGDAPALQPTRTVPDRALDRDLVPHQFGAAGSTGLDVFFAHRHDPA